MNIIRLQQIILVIAFLLWGQSSIRYALEGAFGNRFIGAVTIVGISSFLLVLSYFAPQYLTKTVALLFIIGALAICIFFVWM